MCLENVKLSWITSVAGVAAPCQDSEPVPTHGINNTVDVLHKTKIFLCNLKLHKIM